MKDGEHLRMTAVFLMTLEGRVYRPGCAGVATPPVGTVASAVLVDFSAGSGFSALTVSLTTRS